MTALVLLVILYRAFFWFARGVEKNIRILTKNYFPLTHYFMKALLFLWQRTAPPKIKNAPPPDRNCTPLNGFLSKLESFAKKEAHPVGCASFLIWTIRTRTHLNATVRWTVAIRRLNAGCSLMSSSPISSTRGAFSETGRLDQNIQCHCEPVTDVTGVAIRSSWLPLWGSCHEVTERVVTSPLRLRHLSQRERQVSRACGGRTSHLYIMEQLPLAIVRF